jgi:hypothetical protein
MMSPHVLSGNVFHSTTGIAVTPRKWESVRWRILGNLQFATPIDCRSIIPSYPYQLAKQSGPGYAKL